MNSEHSIQEIIINLSSIIEKPNGFLIDVSGSEIMFSHIDLNIRFEYESKNNIIILRPISFPLAHHIWRVTKKKLQNDDYFKMDHVFDVINCIINVIATGPYKYCAVCSSDIPSLQQVGYCNKKNISDEEYSTNCFDIFCHLVTDNCIIDNYKHDPLSVLFLIKISIECLNSQKKEVFNPFPGKYEKDGLKDFDRLIQVTSKYSEGEFKGILNTSESELDVINRLGGDLYGFIKFVILTNKTYIRSEKISGKQIFNDEDSLEINNEIKFINFQVIHNPRIEGKFRTDKPQYLFHGSAIGNWYSIMRNGLKNYSGTNMMAHGMSFGAGIYLTDRVHFSLGYSRSNKIHKTDDKSQILYVIGVVQILDESEQYKRAPQVYVVPDENKILLRYLILTNGNNLDTVQKYVMVNRVDEIVLYNRNITPIIIRRLKQELKNIEILPKKYQQLKKLKIQTNDTCSPWLISFDEEQMIEIKIPDNYPVDPPFIRVVKPKIKGSVFINDLGVVNLPELSIKKWSAKTKLADMVVKIYELLKISNKESGEYEYGKAYESYCESILF